MQLKFLARSENEVFARNAVAAFALSLNPTLAQLSDVKTAVSEAVTNSIVHGYTDKEGWIRISCKTDENFLHMTSFSVLSAPGVGTTVKMSKDFGAKAEADAM